MEKQDKELEASRKAIQRLIDERYKPSIWVRIKENSFLILLPIFLLIFMIMIFYLAILLIQNPLSLFLFCIFLLITFMLILYVWKS